MKTQATSDFRDRGFDYDYELTIWVRAQKTFDEFLHSLGIIIHPLEIKDNEFNLGEIGCMISMVQSSPPKFEGVPDDDYQFRIVVDTPGHLIWSGFCRQFALSLTTGIRTKFESTYLVTNDQNQFVYYSGTNKPNYINPNYESWKFGELNGFRNDDSIEIKA